MIMGERLYDKRSFGVRPGYMSHLEVKVLAECSFCHFECDLPMERTGGKCMKCGTKNLVYRKNQPKK